MDWWLALLVILGSLFALMITGLPVAFCFLILITIGAFFFWRGEAGLAQLVFGLKEAVASYNLLPIPLFILMGAVMFHSGVAPNMITAVDKWLGRMPGRLGLLAVGAGTIFATLSGSSSASVALLSSTLVPEMEKRGYKKPMSLGPILGSGGLAFLIPPSGFAVFIAILAEVSVGDVLIAIIFPGLLMAALYATYIIGRSQLQPYLAPPYETAHVTLSQKLIATAIYILPLGLIVFLVIGVMLMGWATPSEAAATGAFGTFILAACYRKLNWQAVKKAVGSTFEITVMLLLIIAAAKVYSQILATSGASRGLIMFATDLPLAPIVLVIAMQILVIIMGMFMNEGAITLICIPLFVPVVRALGFDPVWFVVMFLIGIEMAGTSPPFGLLLFIMQRMAPPGTTFGDLARAAVPFLVCDTIAITLILVFPPMTLWLPSIMLG